MKDYSPAHLPVQRSLLSAQALAETVLVKYDLPGPPNCTFWTRGINDTYRVQAAERTFMLRVAPTGWRSHDHLAAEIQLLEFLLATGLSVPRPVSQRDGTSFETLIAPEGPRHAVLFTAVPGVAAAPLNEEYAHRYGAAIARLHLATEHFPADRGCFRFTPQEMIDIPLARLKPLFAEHPDDYAYLASIAPELKQTAESLSPATAAYGLCHGDVNNGNILFHGQTGWSLIDFEYCGYGWQVFDIATFINNQVYNLDRSAETRATRAAFLAGYQALRPLSEAELATLPRFVMLRQFWLLGVGARNLPNIGRQLFDHWVFDLCIPYFRAWMAAPW